MFKTFALAGILYCLSLTAASAVVVHPVSSAFLPESVVVLAQSSSGQIISKSQAAQIAKSVAPNNKLLRIRLSKGASPMYVVKTRDSGRIREIVINAKTGAIIRK